MVAIWNEAIEELNGLGEASKKTVYNPVTWGVVTGIVYMIQQGFICMSNGCSKEGFTSIGVIVLMIWSLTIFNMIPIITLFLKLLKNSIEKFATIKIRQTIQSLGAGERILVAIGGFCLSLPCYLALDTVKVYSHCMRFRDCFTQESFTFHLLQKVSDWICGSSLSNSNDCFIWMINTHWLLTLAVVYGVNTLVIEEAWHQPQQNDGHIPKNHKEFRPPSHQSKKFKSIDPNSLNYDPNWNCVNHLCPNHSSANLCRFKNKMFHEDWRCGNVDCDHHVDSRGPPSQRHTNHAQRDMPYRPTISTISPQQEIFKQYMELHMQQLARQLGKIVCKHCKAKIQQVFQDVRK